VNLLDTDLPEDRQKDLILHSHGECTMNTSSDQLVVTFCHYSHPLFSGPRRRNGKVFMAGNTWWPSEGR
jgi:hypothetical protein